MSSNPPPAWTRALVFARQPLFTSSPLYDAVSSDEEDFDLYDAVSSDDDDFDNDLDNSVDLGSPVIPLDLTIKLSPTASAPGFDALPASASSTPDCTSHCSDVSKTQTQPPSAFSSNHPESRFYHHPNRTDRPEVAHQSDVPRTQNRPPPAHSSPPISDLRPSSPQPMGFTFINEPFDLTAAPQPLSPPIDALDAIALNLFYRDRPLHSSTHLPTALLSCNTITGSAYSPHRLPQHHQLRQSRPQPAVTPPAPPPSPALQAARRPYRSIHDFFNTFHAHDHRPSSRHFLPPLHQRPHPHSGLMGSLADRRHLFHAVKRLQHQRRH
jgi:hypothetical protein